MGRGLTIFEGFPNFCSACFFARLCYEYGQYMVIGQYKPTEKLDRPNLNKWNFRSLHGPLHSAREKTDMEILKDDLLTKISKLCLNSLVGCHVIKSIKSKRGSKAKRWPPAKMSVNYLKVIFSCQS